MTHFIEKCECGITLNQCRCMDKNKEVRVRKPCTHQTSTITTGDFPKCEKCNKTFIAPHSQTLCNSCKPPEPKQYKAMTVPAEKPDPFTGKRSREVTGYYFKKEGTLHAWDEGQPDDSEHYIVCTGFADWNMPREIELHKIDINTLEELKK